VAEEFTIGEALEAFDKEAYAQREAEKDDPPPSDPMAGYAALLRTGMHPPEECGDPMSCEAHHDLYVSYYEGEHHG
jgi:hypothetical protein